MNGKNKIAVAGAVAASLLVWSGAASAASGTAVSVRVEGLKRGLLPPTVVHVHTGSITRYGAPSGACPASSAAGALDSGTRHHWVGTWSSSFSDYEITSVLGERHTFTSKYFWEVFVNNVAAQSGACALTLHRTDQLLFAAVPQNGTAYPIVLRVLGEPVVGQALEIKVYYRKGHTSKPISGARVAGTGIAPGTTNAQGIATITPTQPGELVVRASASKHDAVTLIRSAPLTLLVVA
jgi:hypothetical protein